MSYQPIIPMSGLGGWKFLQATYDRQLANHSASPQVRRERDYMMQKLSGPVSAEEFVKDKRLLKSALTAFGLAGEEWKGGLISRVLKEAGDPSSTFLNRMNNPRYTAFAQTFRPVDGKIQVDQDTLARLSTGFEEKAFSFAVGETDDTMRLALNYKSEIAGLAVAGRSDAAVAYRLLADPPVANVVRTALNIPESTTKLPVERQAELIKAGLKKLLGVSALAEISAPEHVDKLLKRFHIMSSINNPPGPLAPGAAALQLLSGANYGFGENASQNLLFSLLS
jgi:hypothetical protein